jgi:hypothetical protein
MSKGCHQLHLSFSVILLVVHTSQRAECLCFVQGAMQGALFGARSLATGMGPVIFASVFSLFSRSDSRLPYFPGIFRTLDLALQ